MKYIDAYNIYANSMALGSAAIASATTFKVAADAFDVGYKFYKFKTQHPVLIKYRWKKFPVIKTMQGGYARYTGTKPPVNNKPIKVKRSENIYGY